MAAGSNNSGLGEKISLKIKGKGTFSSGVSHEKMRLQQA